MYKFYRIYGNHLVSNEEITQEHKDEALHEYELTKEIVDTRINEAILNILEQEEDTYIKKIDVSLYEWTVEELEACRESEILKYLIASLFIKEDFVRSLFAQNMLLLDWELKER